MEIVCHHPELRPLLRDDYTRAQLERVRQLLRGWPTLELNVQENGLVRAVDDGGRNPHSGYHRTWIRDTVHVAHALWRTGDTTSAVHACETMLAFHRRTLHRFDDVIAGRADPDDPMQRPHVRFDGDHLREVEERWAHAQNDALGYLLWLAASLWREGDFEPDPDQRQVLARYPRYFEAINYWRDRDSGHWEEDRRVNASSIGVVVAALEALADAVGARGGRRGLGQGSPAEWRRLAGRGREVLARTLPLESPPERESDAALLFLLAPLDLLDDAHSLAVIDRIDRELTEVNGIKRYVGDSYWCADYRELLRPEQYSTDYSHTTAERDRLLKPGTEAQWCIFDPVLSVWFGWRFARTGAAADRRRQVWHLNRSLGQITGEGEWCLPGLCSEAWFLASSAEGIYRPNDQTPLAWTQANLRLALHTMASTSV